MLPYIGTYLLSFQYGDLQHNRKRRKPCLPMTAQKYHLLPTLFITPGRADTRADAPPRATQGNLSFCRARPDSLAEDLPLLACAYS